MARNEVHRDVRLHSRQCTTQSQTLALKPKVVFLNFNEEKEKAACKAQGALQAWREISARLLRRHAHH